MWSTPDETAVTKDRLPLPIVSATVTGIDEPEGVPLPSWPASFSPQHSIAVVVKSAQAWLWPAETAVAFVIPLTAAGADELARVPLPN